MILVACLVMVILPRLFTIDQVGVYFLGIKWPMHCLLDSLLGVKCALCGMTRSFSSIAHGQFSQAFEYHLIGPILYTYFLMQIPYRLYAIARYPLKPVWKIRKAHFYVSILMISAIIINWLIYLGGTIL